MSDEVFDEISRFDNEFRPEAARRPGLDILSDGDYDFEILDARPDRTPRTHDAILRVSLKVLSGPCAGQVIEQLHFLISQDGIDRLGSDLATLGFDTDVWKPPARPFSSELQKALPRLRGIRFRARKQANKSGEKTYQNLYVNARLTGSAMPPPAPPAPVPQTQTPSPAGPPSEYIPF